MLAIQEVPVLLWVRQGEKKKKFISFSLPLPRQPSSSSSFHVPFRFHGDLVLSATQGIVLQASHIRQGLQDCVQAVLTASCHGQAGLALARMRLYLLTDQLALKQGAYSSRTLLRGLNWHLALERWVASVLQINWLGYGLTLN